MRLAYSALTPWMLARQAMHVKQQMHVKQSIKVILKKKYFVQNKKTHPPTHPLLFFNKKKGHGTNWIRGFQPARIGFSEMCQPLGVLGYHFDFVVVSVTVIVVLSLRVGCICSCNYDVRLPRVFLAL